MRVAISQFATTLNTQENLASCLRMINEAATCKPFLIILPEYCNALSWYADHNHAWNAALAIDGDFLQSIAEQAKNHGCYIMVNVTLRRDIARDHQDDGIKSNITVTSCLFSPVGKLVQQVDKQILLGHENYFFISPAKTPEVTITPFGTLGILTGSDDLSFSTPHNLALSGAQLLCQSMSAFTLDQSSLHGPTRACENKVFLATANKIGALVPQEYPVLTNSTDTLTLCPIPQDYLVGIGQSQILSPQGKVLAKITHNEEAFVFADIALDEANTSNKFRPDGTDLIKQRRPELYQMPEGLNKNTVPDEDNNNLPVTVNVAIFATYKSNETAIEDVCFYIENNLSDIIQLPELFFLGDKSILNNAKQMSEVSLLCQQLVSQISAVLRPFQYVCTSLVIDGAHQAVIISEHGLFATQQQLHFCQRYQWTVLGSELNTISLHLEQGEISVAMLTADDAQIPEMIHRAALNNIHLLLVPFDIQDPCEVEYCLISRAAEHRICILAATREKSFANEVPSDQSTHNKAQHKIQNKKKIKTQKSTGFIANLAVELTHLTPEKLARFKGYLNQPLLKHQQGKITKALIHPNAASNKVTPNKTIW